MQADKEHHILSSWYDNARAWATAIQNDEIDSRRLVTNQAIVEAVMKYQPATVLDVGCGEGWLSRALGRKGVDVTGIDAVPELVEKARQQGLGAYEVCSYQELAEGRLTVPHPFDVAVFNFSLFGDTSARQALAGAYKVVCPRGKVIVQTLHPLMAGGDVPYRDGWRKGSWEGFSQAFSNPAPWYFRTLSSWIALFTATGWQLTALTEPLHPTTRQPASVIFVVERHPQI